MIKVKNNPIVSVIIATYDRGEYIEKAIKSVLAQVYKNVEIIVIDDGSTDNTKKIIKDYISSGKIKYIYQENTGSMKARDKAIGVAKGKYIAILDSDDFWCECNKLKKQVDFLEKNQDYILTGGGVIKINKAGKEIFKYLPPEKNEDIRKQILLRNVFIHSTVVFRKSGWEKTGGYCKKDSNFIHDWILWLELGKQGKLYNFKEYFVKYLEAGQNTGGKFELKANLKFRKKYKNNYPGYKKAILICWATYFYHFLFFRKVWKKIIK